MAADSYGTKNEPQFAASGAPDNAGDLTAVAAYAALVGNTKIGTSTARQALTGKQLWVGLGFYETDTDSLWLNRSTGWAKVIEDTGWIDPSFVNGGNSGGTNTPAQYRRRNGVVTMTGFWVPTTNSEIQFRLPAGFRPKNTMTFWCERGSGNGPGAKMEVQVGTGSVIYRGGPSGATGAVDYGLIQFNADA